MSQILVIVPPEWTKQEYDYIVNLTGITAANFNMMSGMSMTDLNAQLESLGYFTDEKRVVDVMVISDQIFFKLE